MKKITALLILVLLSGCFHDKVCRKADGWPRWGGAMQKDANGVSQCR
jgi:hypothetical protein